MDLAVIVSVDLTIKNALSLSDIGHIIPHTRSYESILKPTIGPLNLPLGLWGDRA